MNVSDVISRARTLLNDNDSANYRWTDAELINAINDGQKVVAIYRPDSSPADAIVSLDAGTKQSIPSGGFRLLDLVRNIGADGATPGRSIRITNRETLDSFDPYWHNGIKKTEVRQFVYDERNPLIFYVTPPVLSGTKVEMLYSKYPPIVTQPADALTISDAYFEVIVNYVMYKAYSKDAEFSANLQLAATYLGNCSAMLGVKLQKDVAFSPAFNREGSKPPAGALQAGGL